MKNSRVLALFVGDLICFAAAFILLILIGFPAGQFESQASIHAPWFVILVMIWFVILFIFNFYDIQKSKPNAIFFRNLGIAATIMLPIGFAFFYIIPELQISPKTNLILFEGISLLLILGWRRLFYLTTINAFHTRFAVVCPEETYHPLIAEIADNPQLGYESCGSFHSLSEFTASNKEVDLLIIHKTAESETELLEKILASHIEVIDLPEAYERILYKIPIDFIDHSWIIRSITKTTTFAEAVLVRFVSIVFALVIGILTLPITILIIIAIKIEDRGPILLKNDRVGKHGKIFYLYKFRSMVPNAEKNGAQWAQESDPRITRVGRITRKLHIDEIPQMINVLKGDLTLVGPRPERPEFVAELEKQIPYYFMRHAIQPGFTGWAQIKFRYARSVMDSQEKFEYDLYYIKNRNLFLDFGIIIKTVQIIFTH